MKLLFLSDFHGAGVLPDVTPDAVILLGDIDYYEIRNIDAHYACPKFGVLGNHDGPDYFDNTRIVNLHQRVIEWNGYTFAGFEGSPTYNKRKYLQYTEEQVHAFTHRLPQVDFFIAHSNPAAEPVWDETNPHRGFVSFTDYIHEKKPRYLVHGHIHEEKSCTIGETTVLSVYPYFVLDI